MPAFDPRIILQTATHRVIARNFGPFEGKERADEIVIEASLKNLMGEVYWHPVKELHASRHGMTRDDHLMLSLFCELSAARQKQTELGNMVRERVTRPRDPIIVDAEPPRPSKADLLELADVYEVLATMAKGQVVIPPDMPFDNRDNGVGLDMSPGLIGRLHKLFPGWPRELTPVQLVMALMERTAEVLRQ